MKLIVSSEFEQYYAQVPNHIKKKVSEKIQEMEFQSTLEGLNAMSLVGFPYIYKIEIENYSFCFYQSKNHI